ncbi:MAG: M56 family metallopeptidase [Thermoguttaceae bacterium]
MVLSAAGTVQAIVQATLLMATSALLVRGLIGFSRCVSANTQRIVWFLVLVQGVILVRLPLNVPWYASPPLPSATTDLPPAPASGLADDPPRERSRPPLHPLSGDPFSRPATANSPAAETRPAPARLGVTSSLMSVWQWVLLLWGLGMILCVAVGLWRYIRFVWRLQAVESSDEDWAAQWLQLLASRGVKRLIPFRVSRDVGPALVRLPSGYQVVVPEAAWDRLTSKQRRLILCHELAHYEQGDLWRLLAVRLLALPHWFNPASWWAVRKFEECTEWLCDCAAANESTSAASAIEYAQALMQLGSSRFPQTSWVGAAQGSRLFNRVHRLLSNPFPEDSKMKKFVLVSIVLGLLLAGSVRIRLVAKEPATKAEQKPAAEKEQPTDENQAKNPAGNRSIKATEKPEATLADLSEFPDEPAAHAMFNQLIETLQKAESLSYRSRMTCVSKDDSRDTCYYRSWLKKPNYCRIELETKYEDPKMEEFVHNRGTQAVLVGDGKTFWIYWPKGRPHFNCEDTDIYEKTYLNSYLKSSATSDKASIWEEMGHTGNSYPCFDLSLFHGRKTQLQWVFDAVRSRGIENVGGEDCDRIEVVEFNDHRWTFWLSKTDHLPRKVEYLFHVDWVKNVYDQVHTEQWSDVTLNADMPNALFAWQPPKGWTEWKFSETKEEMLKPGTVAPDFKLASADGKPIQLSNYRGQPVWLCFWAATTYPDSTPDGKVRGRYDLRRIQKIYARYKDSGLIVLGYNATDDAKLALETMRANGVTFPTILDISNESRKIRSRDYKINGFNAKDYVIDRTGKIITAFYEKFWNDDDASFLEKADVALQSVGGEVGTIAQRRVDARVAGSATRVSTAAQRLFQAIREADYNKDWSKPKDWKQFPAMDVNYDVAHGFPFWVKWVCDKFKADPIVDVQLGKVFTDFEGRPTVHFRLTLKDGENLQGDLPFIRNNRSGHENGKLTGIDALDWHLQNTPEKKP